MWPDNETDVDLLGFDILADGLVVALTESRLLPLTVGVLGDWGSGKSSLMGLACAELTAEAEARYACVRFSPWQYEDYDDVKVALMAAVLAELGKQAAGRRREGSRSRAAEGVLAAVWPAQPPGGAGGGAGCRPRLRARDCPRDRPSADPAVVLARTAGPRRGRGRPWRAAWRTRRSPGRRRAGHGRRGIPLPLRRPVRSLASWPRWWCSSTTWTAACRRRWWTPSRRSGWCWMRRAPRSSSPPTRRSSSRPSMPATLSYAATAGPTGIGAQYLEKMLQLKIAVPALAVPEAITYVNLLLAELHLPAADFARLREHVAAQRVTDSLGVVFNLGTLGDLGIAVPPGLSVDLQWAAVIAPVLARGSRGNPRQIKRFLNTLQLRRRAANRKRVSLEPAVLGKLMLLEDQHFDDFQQLFDWQVGSGGPSCPQLAAAEALARGDDAGRPVRASGRGDGRAGGGRVV